MHVYFLATCVHLGVLVSAGSAGSNSRSGYYFPFRPIASGYLIDLTGWAGGLFV